ncbi:hypothetical protein RCXUPER_144 [Rhodobacter phage RcXuper]|nr:hypothetical protein RCXUPER_144 [Rhodobacter phage RcXuper]
MITVMADDGVTEIALNRVDHLGTAQEAAQHLWESVYGQAKVHGGEALLLTPNELFEPRYAVRWVGGPAQWSQAYTVSEGADAREFVASTLDDFTVSFSELDA